MRNIFLKNHTQNVVENPVSDPFLKNQNWVCCDLQIEKIEIYSLQFYTSFLLYIEVKDYRKILKLRCRPLAFTTCNDFSKNKRGLELVSLHHFLHDFRRKTFLALHSINWAILNVFLLLLLEILGNICVVIVCNQVATS